MKKLLIIISMILMLPSFSVAQNPSHLKWREYESDNFMLYYSEGQEMTAFGALEVAEAVNKALKDMYGPIDGKVSLVIKDTEDFANGGAYFYDNKIEISATSLDYAFRSYSNWLWNVMTHELAHIYSIHQSMKGPRWVPMAYYQHIDYQQEKREDVLVGYPNVIASYPLPMFNVPAWLAEGTAQYNARGARYDRWDAHRDMILRQASLNDDMLGITEMASFNWTGRENEMVYDHGYGLILYVGEKYGDEKITEIMRAMRAATAITFNVACKRVLGISQYELYDNWVATLKARYEKKKEDLGELIEGKAFRTGGFINGYPSWSPDGSKLAYVTNIGQDYGITMCRIANLSPDGWQWKNKEKDVVKRQKQLQKKIDEIEKEVDDDDAEKIETIRQASAAAFDITFAGGIQTTPVWLDEWNILFNRRMSADKHGSHWWDINRYVINNEDPRKGTRKRISHNLRGTYPDLSPDKSELVFVKNESGLNNLFIMDRDDNSLTQLTFFKDGTHIYKPRFSPNGDTIVFTMHQKSEVDIAIINRDGSGLKNLVASPGQDRDPEWNSDGSSIVFSSDLTGIANIYRMSIQDGDIYRLTNVIGGAFQPDISPADTTIAFSYYGAKGYEIRVMPMADGTPVDDSGLFHKDVRYAMDNPDAQYPISETKPYKMKTLDFSYMPLIRNDQGNLKIGSYILKSEMIDEANFIFSGAYSPTNKDMDLYSRFEYRKFVPTVFIEMYRLTRSVGRNENFMDEFGTIIRRRVYDLNEIDFGMNYTYKDKHNFEGRLIYSQYNAKVEYTHFLTGPRMHKPYYTYSRGFDMQFTYGWNRYIRARDEVINPRGGRKVDIRYDRNINFFLDEFEYAGFLKEKYKKYPYNKYYIRWSERFPVPRTKKHTLVLGGMANIIDKQVDDFYELQLGGPRQMRGYTFYSMSGRKNLMANALYRFPLLYDVRKGFSAWYLNHVYMGVFADVGRAWNKNSMNFSTKGFKRDAGIELRFDSTSFYNFPTMVEFSTAYGPDDTWIKQLDTENSRYYLKKDDQSPWKFYASVLFGF